MFNNSTTSCNINKMNNYLSPQIWHLKSRFWLGTGKKMCVCGGGGGFKWLMESKPFPLDNSISNGNTDINKQ